jgi:hypothetical protein
LDELAAETLARAHAILERHDVVAERAQRDGKPVVCPVTQTRNDLLVRELLEILVLEKLVDGDPDRPGDLSALLARAGGAAIRTSTTKSVFFSAIILARSAALIAYSPRQALSGGSRSSA